MKRLAPVLGFLALVALPGCAPEQDSNPITEPTNRLDVAVDSIRACAKELVAAEALPSIVIAVAKSGRIVLEEGYGLANMELGTPADGHTPYPIASLTKPITATALMMLVEDGLVTLDAPIDDYLPQGRGLRACVGSATDATVARVATHTAGLPLHSNHFYLGEAARPRPVDETIGRYGMIVSEPGQRYQYSNLGFGLLGYVIEQASGIGSEYSDGYAEFVERRVFDALGMNDAFVYGGTTLPPNCAEKYTSDGVPVPPYTSDTPAATSVYASAHDLIRFCMFHLQHEPEIDNEILSTASLDRMQTPVSGVGSIKAWHQPGSGSGLGWLIGITGDGTKVVYHSGGTLGVSCEMALVPGEDLAVVVLCNTTSREPEALLVRIVTSILPVSAEEFIADADPPTPDNPMGSRSRIPHGAWHGLVRLPDDDVPMTLECLASGEVIVQMGGHPPATLKDVSFSNRGPLFLNSGIRPYLRGWFEAEIDNDDVERGRPYRTWLELADSGSGSLSGTLVCFSQRDLPTGPLSHWVQLHRAQ